MSCTFSMCLCSMQQLENTIRGKGYRRIIVETATVLHEACRLYESAGYLPLVPGGGGD